MKIRIADAADAAALIEFNQAMAFETEQKRLDPELIKGGVEAVFADDRKGFYLVAEEDGAVIGGLMITYEWSDWRSKWFWWIQSVYVVPKARGRAIYSSMYAFVKNLAERKGDVCGFRLYVEKDNLHARTVYEKLGMEASHYLMYEENVKAEPLTN